MLRQRLTYGPLMIAALVLVFIADSYLDQVNLTGTIWQRVFLGRTYLPAGLIMLAAFLALIPLGAAELCRIFAAKNLQADRFMVTLAGMTGCLVLYSMPSRFGGPRALPGEGPMLPPVPGGSQQAMLLLATLVVLLFVLALVKHSWHGRTQGAIAAASMTMFALIYLGLAPGFCLAIRRWHSAWVIAGIILVTKSCDIGAFFTGTLIGRHKLIPWLSPGKTWEGLVGGVTLSTLSAMFLGWLGAVGNAHNLQVLGVYTREGAGRMFHPQAYPLWALAIAGALFGLVGHFGDLMVSLFKRDAGIKDSGASIPGFGGLLDVADSPVMVAPLAYWLLALGRMWQR